MNFIGVTCPNIDPAFPNVPLERVDGLGPEYHRPCEVVSGDLPYRYREQTIERDAATHRPETMISFGSCKEDRQSISYSSLNSGVVSGLERVSSDWLPLQVTVTTAAYTIRADHVVFHRKEMTFTASGKVLVEDGTSGSIHGDSATVRFVKGAPKIQMNHSPIH